MERIRFLNIYIDNFTMLEAVQKLDHLLQQKNPAYVVTPNLDHIVLLEKDVEFRKVYDNADLILADGKPLIWISKYLKRPIKEKVSGSDFFPNVCELANRKGYSIFILGAATGVANKAAENLLRKYPNIKIAGTYSPPVGFEKDEKELDTIKNKIKYTKPDILAVSLGSPKGEKFIYKHLYEYEIPVSMSIGATIDFLAGNVKRCPSWMSNCGFEWLYRVIKEPRRLSKRYWNDAKCIIPIIRKYKNN